MVVPNMTYCKFESFASPLIHEMYLEQKEKGTIFTPSIIINRLGKAINNEDSIYYWCWKNNIPVFCPAITDGALGDIIHFHSYNHDGFIVDITADVCGINDMAVNAKKSGIFVLGAGVVKHHICNANWHRGGADYAVYVNTAVELDGSDAGARPDEAVSWGKIHPDGISTKVWAEASMVFPILMAETFVKNFELARKI